MLYKEKCIRCGHKLNPDFGDYVYINGETAFVCNSCYHQAIKLEFGKYYNKLKKPA